MHLRSSKKVVLLYFILKQLPQVSVLRVVI